ncbi:MAG: tocopherol cyclase family protein [Chitinophagales bacterium]|nr:hypothetical protein [Bacteroidota bacterium]MCB9044212.1 hypothetical protein [Chitinophagales bacterium]
MNLLHKLRAVWHPEMYHGWGKQKKYFEGWYFKMVAADKQAALAIIPGVSMSAQGEKHAFIQVLDAIHHKVSYHRFAFEEFNADPHKFAIQIGKNSFSTEGISLQLSDVQGHLQWHNTNAWQKSFMRPGIMGWYGFIPSMECYHGLVSLYHGISGNLVVQGQHIDFEDGRGYIEKDWGRSFPEAWVWMQSNTFRWDREVSFMCSVAKIPWLGKSFIGFLAILYIDEAVYTFTTYTKAKIGEIKIEPPHIFIKITDKQGHLLLIKAQQAEGSKLASPINGEMTGKINESLGSEIEIRFFKGNKLIYTGTGKCAGMEISDNYTVLLPKK